MYTNYQRQLHLHTYMHAIENIHIARKTRFGKQGSYKGDSTQFFWGGTILL